MANTLYRLGNDQPEFNKARDPEFQKSTSPEPPKPTNPKFKEPPECIYGQEPFSKEDRQSSSETDYIKKQNYVRDLEKKYSEALETIKREKRLRNKFSSALCWYYNFDLTHETIHKKFIVENQDLFEDLLDSYKDQEYPLLFNYSNRIYSYLTSSKVKKRFAPDDLSWFPLIEFEKQKFEKSGRDPKIFKPQWYNPNIENDTTLSKVTSRLDYFMKLILH